MVRGIIKPLSESVKSLVRSGVLVFDFSRVVEELIYNSLDAGATKVYTSNVFRYICCVCVFYKP